MAATTQAYTTVELMTVTGPEYRRVSTAKTRPATADEIPVIDLEGMWFYDGDEAAATAGEDEKRSQSKARIAAAIRAAATGPGFFYVTNHGIPAAVIDAARDQATRFLAQPLADKMRLHLRQDPLGNGYSPVRTGQVNRSSATADYKEGFSFRYQPEHDPLHAGATTPFPPHLSQGAPWIWERTAHLPGFQAATVAWWQHCLRLARGLVRLFARALDLPETYFDAVTTHPGSDGLYIRYPGQTPSAGADAGTADEVDVGIGAHTDMQCFTLLWQDESGGLEVLLPRSGSGNDDDEDHEESTESCAPGTYEWVGATPRPGTLVVNIADFLQRLSNNRFRSTVHRVYNRQAAPRLSMPFFFGFNYDAECAVVPTCVDADHPPRYAPISCGQWRDARMAQARATAKAGPETEEARNPLKEESIE